jgi:hypothetical protein
MSFDSSRFTFDSWNDFLGVVMQQGRVQLDSDWNELLAEFARRIQAGTLDILGQAVYPATTPYAFKINASQDANGNHITIGSGRMYVDGLLVENHGPAPAGSPRWESCQAELSAPWDPLLAELSNTPPHAAEVDVDYTLQPYWPGASLSQLQGNGPFLAYLDVWQRAVTYLEYPHLVDQAVGVDTTGRLQTVWQVKLLSVGSGVTCSTPDSEIPLWETLIQPSAGRLTINVVSSTSSGPCCLTPNTGHTGMENQFYRVEIHKMAVKSSIILNPSKPATFKWSRDNASVATAVTANASVTNTAKKPASQLTVQSMGRNQVLGFTAGNWIEITDDYQELNGLAGELHKIDSIVASANAIILDSTVSLNNGILQLR